MGQGAVDDHALTLRKYSHLSEVESPKRDIKSVQFADQQTLSRNKMERFRQFQHFNAGTIDATESLHFLSDKSNRIGTIVLRYLQNAWREIKSSFFSHLTTLNVMVRKRKSPDRYLSEFWRIYHEELCHSLHIDSYVEQNWRVKVAQRMHRMNTCYEG